MGASRGRRCSTQAQTYTSCCPSALRSLARSRAVLTKTTCSRGRSWRDQLRLGWEDSGRLSTRAAFFLPGEYTIALQLTRQGSRPITDELRVTVEGAVDDASPMVAQGDGPRQLQTTIHSLGVEWDLEGDQDHDAYGLIRYRRQGQARWRSSPPLVRIDYEIPADLNGASRPRDEPRGWNMLAGSALFLEPGVSYEVDVLLGDPDGGFARHTAVVQTQPEPEVPTQGRLRYVVPGEGGGSGTEEDPFRGVEEANDQAQAGDVFLLAPGTYGRPKLDKGGDPERPIVWSASPGQAPPVWSGAWVGADHVWLFGLHFERGRYEDGIEVEENGGVRDLVVRRCRFQGFQDAIAAEPGSHGWRIMDNVIVGANDPDANDRTGEGVDLQHTSGHVVAYNTISRVADGVSFPRRDCDIYGNDIYDTSDDSIETDYALANVRIWGNRLRRSYAHIISFQPQRSGPWYILYNQVHSTGYKLLKFHGIVDRNVFYHNTFVYESERLAEKRDIMLSSSVTRNNLFVTPGARVLNAQRYNLGSDGTHIPPVSFYQVDWRTDLDYDGFAWDRESEGAPLVWLDRSYENVMSWSSGADVEPHGRGLELEGDIGLPLDREFMELPDGSAAIDAGEWVFGLHTTRQVVGSAPDLGAHERGAPLTHYGVRSPSP